MNYSEILNSWVGRFIFAKDTSSLDWRLAAFQFPGHGEGAEIL
jgi:hypothetical protein